MDCDLLAIEMGRIDDRLCLVLEHLRAEAGADATVAAAGRGDLDDVGAAPALPAHRLAALAGAVAPIVVGNGLVQFLTNAEAGTHVPRRGRDRGRPVTPARPRGPPAGRAP